MSRAYLAAVVAICFALASSAAIAETPWPRSGSFSLNAGFTSISLEETKSTYGSGAYTLGAEYRVAGSRNHEQTVSLSYLRSSGGRYFNYLTGTHDDCWLSGWTVGTTYRKTPSYQNRFYYGFGGGVTMLSENRSASGSSEVGTTHSNVEAHFLAGIALAESVRLEGRCTLFFTYLSQSEGPSTPMGPAFTLGLSGRF